MVLMMGSWFLRIRMISWWVSRERNDGGGESRSYFRGGFWVITLVF
jgi:hypothetical protein